MARINLAADFKDFLKLCLHHKVEFMVVGGYAVVHYSRPRYTGDLDIWVSSSQENAERLVQVLQDFGFKGNEVSTSLITTEGQIVRMGFEPMRLEIFRTLKNCEFHQPPSYPHPTHHALPPHRPFRSGSLSLISFLCGCRPPQHPLHLAR